MDIKKTTALRFFQGKKEEETEIVTVEAALQIKINSRAYTITMRTPGNDIFLAVGLLFTEDIIAAYPEISSINEIPDHLHEHNLIVDLKIDEKITQNKNLFNRSIASSASCGVCGKIDLCDLATAKEPLLDEHRLSIKALPDLFNVMQYHQETFTKTGGSHAASIFSIDRQLLAVQEDIGRHNAVDKVIGSLLINGKLSEAAILCISGRVSYEIVAKCAKAKIPFLLAVSAPSSLAVDFCQQSGITLVAFCRGDKATVYSHPHRITF